MNDNFVIGGEVIPRRTRRLIELELPPLYTHAPMNLPVHVIRGAKDGPRLFVSAAIHLSLIHISEPTRQVLVSRMPSSA